MPKKPKKITFNIQKIIEKKPSVCVCVSIHFCCVFIKSTFSSLVKFDV